LLQRLNAHLHAQKRPPYIVNLDPAVFKLPFECQIDIRDTIDYKQVMSSYNLGPNGGILTSLNLFTTKFDQVLGLIQKRKTTTEHFIIDTPGQIEIFTWSASGAIITESLASELPTVICYVVDTPRTANPSTFMSNMLYACSILYKTKLPFLLVFNKTDVQDHHFALDWMRDFEAFQLALQAKREKEGESGSGYMNSLMNSMALVLDEFYKNLRVSSALALHWSTF
jgi:GTPase SAR1 family protein